VPSGGGCHTNCQCCSNNCSSTTGGTCR
jgi:hypothetical protein